MAKLEAVTRCNVTALRKATRHVSQLYDEMLASSGLRGTQRSILAFAAFFKGFPKEVSGILGPMFSLLGAALFKERFRGASSHAERLACCIKFRFPACRFLAYDGAHGLLPLQDRA